MKNGPYELVIAPANYPGKKYRGRYVYEHHLVWWRHTGELVTNEFLIHHKNEQKRDNSFSNLEKKTRAAHTSEHHIPAKKLLINCTWCNSSFEILERHHRFKVKNLGQTRFYCCRSHQVQYQQKYLIDKS